MTPDTYATVRVLIHEDGSVVEFDDARFTVDATYLLTVITADGQRHPFAADTWLRAYRIANHTAVSIAYHPKHLSA